MKIQPVWLTSLALLAGLFAPSPNARADIKLSSLFTDHMVLQQGAGAWVWGRANKDEPVVVRLADFTANALTDDEGRWACRLEKLPPAGGPYELTVTGREGTPPVVLHDVLVGEVWLCSGQSNMEWTVARAKDAEAEMAAANYPEIRHFGVAKRVASDPEGEVTGAWTRCTPQTVGGYTAVGYFFARELQAKLPGPGGAAGAKMPIGLIHTSWGGTPAETWTPLAAMAGDPELAPIVANWQKVAESYTRVRAEYGVALTRWKEEADRLQAAGQPVPKPPAKLRRSAEAHEPAALYNGMLAPLAPYGIRGALWYQGESNATPQARAHAYRKLLPAMINSWRQLWGQGDFPFLIVQLANWNPHPAQPGDSGVADLREAQMMTAQHLPKTGIVVTLDTGDPDFNIHPRNKQEVGRRLALVAEAGVYNLPGVISHGPIYRAAQPEPGGDKLRVSFLPNPSPLEARGEGGKLRGFAVAGEDKKFAWADAVIDGADVVVSSPRVPRPVAVRYAWADNPEADLFNAAGLPAAPFRSDDWPQTSALPAP